MPKTINTETGHFHAVKFYDSQESLCRFVAEFLGEGFEQGQPGLVIATSEHRDGIVAELRARQCDVDALKAAGDLLLLDANGTLERFMIDEAPDHVRFFKVGNEAIDRVCRGRKDCTIRAYGEMVNVLWKAGQDVAAIRLEMLWNKLALTRDFKLLCGYAMGNFYKGAGLSAIREQHSKVIDAAPTAPASHASTIH